MGLNGRLERIEQRVREFFEVEDRTPVRLEQCQSERDRVELATKRPVGWQELVEYLSAVGCQGI